MTNESDPRQRSKSWLLALFIGTFLISFVCQGIRWKEFDMIDSGMWGHEAEYVLHNDPREFNFLQAYGHPGGPVIEGAILIHGISKIPYDQAVLLLVTILDSLIIAAICVMCFILRKNSLWWIAALGTLSLNTLYDYATPPTAIAAVLIVLLCLLTLYIYEEREKIKPRYLVAWALVGGLAIATRADIGILSFFVFSALLIKPIGWKKVAILGAEAFLAFVIFDPFMWFMPIQHIKDLIFKVVYHYADFQPTHMSLISVISISLLAFVSIFLSVAFLLLRKKLRSPVQPAFIITLILMTIGLYAIFMTARIQTERYYLPILFIWETFLPLFIFSLIDAIEPTFLASPLAQEKARNFFKIFIIVLLYAYQIIFFVQALWLYNVFNLLK